MDIFNDNPVFQGAQKIMRAFAEKHIRPAAMKHDQEESMPWELMKQAQMFGLKQTAFIDAESANKKKEEDKDKPAGPHVKKSAQLSVVGAEELAWGCAGISLALGGSGLAAAPVARLGTQEQKQLFLDCLQGEDEQGRIKVAAMALSEPSTGSDISSLSTSAVRDGKHWILNGSKQWITNGQSASIYVVWAQTDPGAGRAGVRGFLVPRGTPGLIPGRKETKLGIRASETAQVHFEDCKVDEAWMLGGKEAAGLGDTKKMLDSTRPAVGAQAVGIARAAFDYLVEAVRSGEVRGRGLASHQYVAFQIAEMEMEIQASRLLVHRAAWMADHGLENVRFASMAKAHAARTAQEVTRKALTILGEAALEPGHPVEKWYRDAKIYDIFEGTGQIQRRIVARDLFGVNPT
jgi:acyl-CoA dehydrogenase